jgi:hypothetical protein
MSNLHPNSFVGEGSTQLPLSASFHIHLTLSLFYHCYSTESVQDPVCFGAKGEQHTRDQHLLTTLRSGDPIRGNINGVLSEKQVQLGRMFLHMAHVVQEEL